MKAQAPLSIAGAAVLLSLSQPCGLAGRLAVESPVLAQIDAAAKSAHISCRVAWRGAWRNDVNCDGVWLFVKYSLQDGVWKPVTLSGTSPRPFDYADRSPERFSAGDHEALGMWVPSTRRGAFLFRTKGEGDVVSDNVRLVWDWGADGLAEAMLRTVRIRVFGVEMVYVPEGPHCIGDPGGAEGPDNCFYAYGDGGAYWIRSEEPITVDAQPGRLYCDQDNPRSRDDVPFTLPEAFPKGYKAFWCMKYELGSQQYVDFLNTLTRKQQMARVESDISGDAVTNYHVMTGTQEEKLRQSIVCAKQGNGTLDPVTFYTYAPARACNYIAWSDVMAYADWAGLRPITELEYEKACRGPEAAQTEAYAWGTEPPGRVDTFDGADGSGYEKKVPQTGTVNCCFHGGIAPFEIAAGKTVPDNPGFEGPVSIGLFENTRHEGVPKRLNDGASYYGIMEMSGNLWERCVTIGHPKGRGFAGTHGDGELDEDGYADVPDWPGRDGAGGGNRGGVWSSPAGKYLLVGLRFAASNPRVPRGKNSGIRLGF
jgi:formylglycine-generating enzyme required for sulfatase activity